MLGRYVYGQRGLRCNVEYVSYFFFKFLEEWQKNSLGNVPHLMWHYGRTCRMPDLTYVDVPVHHFLLCAIFSLNFGSNRQGRKTGETRKDRGLM